MRKTIREKEPVRPSTKLTRALVAAEVTTRASGGAEESASSRRRLQELVHQLKGDLDWIVMKCLEKDRKRRYATANDLAADLQRYLADELVTARAPSAAYRFQKAFRRNKLIFAAIGAVAGSLLLGVIVSTWQAVRAIHARKAEMVQAGLARVDRDRALRAESTAVQQRDLAQQRLYDSLVREAQSIRTIRALGFRGQLIDRIQKALAIPTPKKNLDELRTEVAQCLGDPISFDPVSLVDPPSLFLDVALNSDGTLVAYGTAGGKLALHETSSGKVASLLEIKAELAQLAFGPDGRSLYGCARQPDGRAGAAPRVSLIEWRRQGNGSWSQQSERSMPDLRRLVLTTQSVVAVIEDSSKREIRLIDVATDRSIGSVPLVPLVLPVSGQPSPVPFDVTSDGHFAAYVGDSETNQPGSAVEVWDLKANELRIRLTPGLGPVRHLQFSPDLRLLACTMENGVLALETSQFKPVNTYRHLMGGRALWCGDTRLALPLSQENGVRLCTVVSGTEATRLTTQHQVKDVRSSLDGSVLLVISHTGPTLVVRLTGSRERQHLTGHVGGTAAVEFSPDGRMIASTGKDGVIRIGEAQTGKTRQAWPIPRGNQGQTVGFSPDGRWLASGNYQNNQVLVWDLAQGRRVLTLGEGGPSSQGTWSCGFSQDGRILIAAGDGLRGWELVLQTAGATDPPLEARELFHHPGEARNLQFDPTGKWIGFEGRPQRNGPSFSGSFIRGLEPGNEPEPISQHKFAVQTFGIDGEGTLLHIDSDRSLVFLNPHSRQSVRRLPTLTTSESVSTFLGNFKISPDGSKVAVANHNGRGVNIQDLASSRRLYTLPDDEAPIWWLAWHPNGRQLAVARGDGDISLWSLVEVEAALAEVGLAP
jgi:WD40 repeat protein